jgi:hypothetical protein
MPAARQKPCEWCNTPFYAPRKDAKWCSDRCRYRAKKEDHKFEYPKLPQSGYVGISFNRYRRCWEVRIPDPPAARWKYVNHSKDLKEAVKMYIEIMEEDPRRVVRERLP